MCLLFLLRDCKALPAVISAPSVLWCFLSWSCGFFKHALPCVLYMCRSTAWCVLPLRGHTIWCFCQISDQMSPSLQGYSYPLVRANPVNPLLGSNSLLLLFLFAWPIPTTDLCTCTVCSSVPNTGGSVYVFTALTMSATTHSQGVFTACQALLCFTKLTYSDQLIISYQLSAVETVAICASQINKVKCGRLQNLPKVTELENAGKTFKHRQEGVDPWWELSIVDQGLSFVGGPSRGH